MESGDRFYAKLFVHFAQNFEKIQQKSRKFAGLGKNPRKS